MPGRRWRGGGAGGGGACPRRIARFMEPCLLLSLRGDASHGYNLIEELDRFLSVKGRKRKKNAKESRSIAEEKDLADLRWRLAKARREELLVEQLNENLVPRGEIAKEWAARVGELTAGLTSLIDRLPPLLQGKDRAEIREIIFEEIWNLRDQYARDGRYSPELAS